MAYSIHQEWVWLNEVKKENSIFHWKNSGKYLTFIVDFVIITLSKRGEIWSLLRRSIYISRKYEYQNTSVYRLYHTLVFVLWSRYATKSSHNGFFCVLRSTLNRQRSVLMEPKKPLWGLLPRCKSISHPNPLTDNWYWVPDRNAHLTFKEHHHGIQEAPLMRKIPMKRLRNNI